MLAEVAQGLRDGFFVRGCPAAVKVGIQYLNDHDAEDSPVQPPDGVAPALTGRGRVVLVPTQDVYGPPSVSNPTTDRRLNPRALMTRRVQCVAHLWAMCVSPDTEQDPVAADYAVMDALINCTLACLNGVALGVYDAGGGTFVNEAVHDRRGVAYQLTFSVACPIIDVKWPPDSQFTFRQAPATAHVQIQELLGGTEEEPPTYQTGAEFNAPDPPTP